ncbi:MAG: hypothetical protein U0270_29780 [Labilithrix sp.]
MNKPAALLSLLSLSILGCFAVGCADAAGEDVADATQHAESSTLVYKHDEPVKFQPLGGRETDTLLLKLFKDGYRKTYEECDTQLPDARIIPTVAGKLPGSFTGTYKREVLYVVNVLGCDASHAEGYGTTRFVVVDPSVTTDVKIVANVEQQGAEASLNRLVDLDHDGQNELVVTGGWSGQGYTMETPSLVRFAGNKLAPDAAFAAYAEKLSATSEAESAFFTDSCGTGNADANIVFANVYGSLSNGKLAFTDQRGTLTCPAEQK